MDSNFPIVYLSLLLVLLSGAAWFVFRQILKTRKLESTFSRLQNKLNNEKGTAQEYYELGSIYLEKKMFVQSVAQLQKALKAPDLEGEENIALVCNALGFAYAAQEQYDLAIRQYKEALKQKPDYVTALNNLGFVYERKKLTSQALEIYEEVLKSEPDNQTAKKRADSLRKRVVTSV
jgi:tetratricopeptide (TPR) repeat protein